MDEAQAPPATGHKRRRLRAVLAADIANFTGLVSISETNTVDALSIARAIARDELAKHSGWLFGMPGDGIFALFESAVDAVSCALDIQTRAAEVQTLKTMRFRIGVHLGEVLFQDDLPFGEALVIAARLESVADPGGILVSEAVMEAVAPRISASFQEKGAFSPKNSPRRIRAFSVSPGPPRDDLDRTAGDGLDRTVLSSGPELSARAVGESREAATAPATERPSHVLPKAAQLVVPQLPDAIPPTDGPGTAANQSSATPSLRTVPAADGNAVKPDELEKITMCFTAHIGPLARVLVKRHASVSLTIPELLKVLANEIPTPAERREFMAEAHTALARTYIERDA
jgi:class 3 adenylate cyclase